MKRKIISLLIVGGCLTGLVVLAVKYQARQIKADAQELTSMIEDLDFSFETKIRDGKLTFSEMEDLAMLSWVAETSINLIEEKRRNQIAAYIPVQLQKDLIRISRVLDCYFGMGEYGLAPAEARSEAVKEYLNQEFGAGLEVVEPPREQ